MLRPGQQYHGTSRTTYLPATLEGLECLELLQKAFAFGLLFVVGDSVTTGYRNTTIWGGIHQKTSMEGGASRHGYPDPHYFNRVKQECGARGVFTDAHDKAAAADVLKLAAKQKQEQDDTSRSSSSGECKTMGDEGDDTMDVDSGDDGDDGDDGDGATTAVLAAFVPHKDDGNLDQMIMNLSQELNQAMKSRNTSAIRQLMAKRNECSRRKKVIEEYEAALG